MQYGAFTGAVIFLMVPLLGLNTKRIVIGDERVVLKRLYKSKIFQKITDVKEAKRGGGLILTGTTPDGKTITKIISPVYLKKRWDEFKEDIQNFKSND